jgi:hypothetical protein
VAAATFFSVSAAAFAAEVSINPGSGSQTETFTVEGSGLQPGLALDVNFISPEGTVYSTAALNKVVVVDADGDFELGVTPATDFAGSSAGTWTVQVCVTGTNDCIQGTFDIAL